MPDQETSINTNIANVFDQLAKSMLHFRYEYSTPELMLKVLLQDDRFRKCFDQMYVPDEYVDDLNNQLDEYLKELTTIPADVKLSDRLETSAQLDNLMVNAIIEAKARGEETFTISDMVYNMALLEDSVCGASLMDCLTRADVPLNTFVFAVADAYGEVWMPPVTEDDLLDESIDFDDTEAEVERKKKEQAWKPYVQAVHEFRVSTSPLVGRTDVLERLMQVLCRKHKNNALLLGNSGVGKTKVVDGLAQLLRQDAPEIHVPESLKGVTIYRLDMGRLMAGSQYKGEFESRLTQVLDALAEDPKTILFIDDMHEVAGKGGGDASMDVASVLMPYLDAGKVRVIGATSHEDFSRSISSKTGLVRRFQTIDVPELTEDETLAIINRLKADYEAFHGVTYDEEVPKFIVRMSVRHLKDRYLPDKALDLLDESGAYVQMHQKGEPRVTKEVVAQVLASMAHVDALTVDDGDLEHLETLKSRITDKIYGQDQAVDRVVEAVQMAKAGLTDAEKPLASLLFVGPTGVGKTEVARVLSRELGVQLVRFDMSEYAEKHTVAKFIGSPAGYVGYDDGGQLTDAVRKNPDCVLLFDEIEKAHSDIFDVLLQVMDYGVLTDNKGRKTHFQNVVIIMTSNAGAQFARQAAVGFASNVTTGQAMLTQVKRTFKPEFINRLSGIVVFSDMDRSMASLILDKKLGELQAMLTVRNVTLTLSDEAHARLLELGYSQEYGAREMDRVINQHVKSLLMREILFGELKNGGEARLEVLDDKLAIAVQH